jgi:hypothetical protein
MLSREEKFVARRSEDRRIKMPTCVTLRHAIPRLFLVGLGIVVVGLTTNRAAADPPATRAGRAENADKQLDPQDARVREHESQHKIKQLALAMHNYHDIHGQFPPAVLIGPDGKTPHSWRVELLPFLDEHRLFNRYRLNEAWDSPHNTVVQRNMPDAFRSPFAGEESTNSSYYALVGPGTIFEGTKGVPLQDITYGTSKTLMLVEAKRDIPWTKPADIPFDPNKPVPQVGGFVKGHFTAACADGSARIFRFEDFKGDELKWAMMRNDGHRFDLP